MDKGEGIRRIISATKLDSNDIPEAVPTILRINVNTMPLELCRNYAVSRKSKMAAITRSRQITQYFISASMQDSSGIPKALYPHIHDRLTRRNRVDTIQIRHGLKI